MCHTPCWCILRRVQPDGRNTYVISIDPVWCASKISSAETVVALTGAGISTAAGVPDFRGPEGLYATGRYDFETTFEIGGFLREPSAFYRFTRDVLDLVRGIRPTFTHGFLAELERRGCLKTVVTQNVDPLHQQAGSRNVIPVHGGYWTSHCLSCGSELGFEALERILQDVDVPRCGCGGLIKPDVVLFGEPVIGIVEAAAAVAGSDLLLVLGSSLAVHPAAMLPECAGGDVIVVNRGPVGLAPAPSRYFAHADLDTFFREVADHLFGE
jgi:NAD-dependent deacetylase